MASFILSMPQYNLRVRMEYITSLDDFGPLITTPHQNNVGYTGNVLKPKNHHNFTIPIDPPPKKRALTNGIGGKRPKPSVSSKIVVKHDKWWPIEWESLQPEFPFKENGPKVIVEPLYSNVPVKIDCNKIWHSRTLAQESPSHAERTQCQQNPDEIFDLQVNDAGDETDWMEYSVANNDEWIRNSIVAQDKADSIEIIMSDLMNISQEVFKEGVYFPDLSQNNETSMECINSNGKYEYAHQPNRKKEQLLLIPGIKPQLTLFEEQLQGDIHIEHTHKPSEDLDTIPEEMLLKPVIKPQLYEDQFQDESCYVAYFVTIGMVTSNEMFVFEEEKPRLNNHDISKSLPTEPEPSIEEIAKLIIDDILQGLNGEDHSYANIVLYN